MTPNLTFHKPHEAHETGRILAFCHKAYIGRINPLGDGRATWELDRSDHRGTAKSVQAAEAALAEAFGQWMATAGLVQT
ncbi:hypothetical protein [Paracoccus saliphilus]|uniref:Uncharacterized protein n=1 Tax=Paracoccus saliphilus TaxID=405559 RepID=A0AA45W5X8_9RHOB|nr:hypothetical protein [Paracoccus saliphilus]WCR01663.1 hypothetical protein JHX88_12045 [Paracoccus saliphilus]SIS98158.1 hypothetical protein SAMN05421772_1115 [Paracoccus saliphilus]